MRSAGNSFDNEVQRVCYSGTRNEVRPSKRRNFVPLLIQGWDGPTWRHCPPAKQRCVGSRWWFPTSTSMVLDSSYQTHQHPATATTQNSVAKHRKCVWGPVMESSWHVLGLEDLRGHFLTVLALPVKSLALALVSYTPALLASMTMSPRSGSRFTTQLVIIILRWSLRNFAECLHSLLGLTVYVLGPGFTYSYLLIIY